MSWARGTREARGTPEAEQRTPEAEQRTPRRAARRPGRRLLLGVQLAALAVFATGVGPRPAGAGWAALYDLVLYNAVFLAGAALCWCAAARSGADRAAWRCLALALGLSTAGNLVYTLVVSPQADPPYPSVADPLYMSYYPMVYAGLVLLVRGRVARFHPSMWLDGLIAGLGAAAAAVALLLGPSLRLTEGTPAAVLTTLAFPLADVLLLSLLVGVAAVMGLRLDRSLWLIGAGLVANLVGDVVYLRLENAGAYTEGGPLDLAWLGGAAAMGLAARGATDPQPPAAGSEPASASRTSGRMLLVPAAFTVFSVALLQGGWHGAFPPAAAWCASASVLAAVARTALTFREVEALQGARKQARTDDLTGLPNRRALFELGEEVVAAATASAPAALLLLDLDGFKEVNDALGHQAGDDLLRQIGPRLQQVLRRGDVLVRLGGDEFAILMPGTALPVAAELAQDARERIGEPFCADGVRVHVGVSIGVAGAPAPATTVMELLRCADIAMYAAKAQRSGVHVHRDDADDASGDRLRTMEDLRSALEADDDQILVHLQPQVRLRDRRVVGVEALVRWQHPTRGFLPPDRFLPAAEQAGLLGPLTDRVLELALDAATTWWDERAPISVSVNLAAANVSDLDLPERVAAALARHHLPPAALVLELVEDTLMSDPERARAVLAQLRARGVRTSIDDYGTGYSSLAYLRDLPADELKLDRAFSAALTTDPKARAIVQHTVALAHGLDLELVAEGVEDEETLDVLTGLGCDLVQGWVIARAMPPADLLAWLVAARGSEDPEARAGRPASQLLG